MKKNLVSRCPRPPRAVIRYRSCQRKQGMRYSMCRVRRSEAVTYRTVTIVSAVRPCWSRATMRC
jgi:hypothetical protein